MFPGSYLCQPQMKNCRSLILCEFVAINLTSFYNPVNCICTKGQLPCISVCPWCDEEDKRDQVGELLFLLMQFIWGIVPFNKVQPPSCRFLVGSRLGNNKGINWIESAITCFITIVWCVFLCSFLSDWVESKNSEHFQLTNFKIVIRRKYWISKGIRNGNLDWNNTRQDWDKWAEAGRRGEAIKFGHNEWICASILVYRRRCCVEERKITKWLLLPQGLARED